MFFQLVITTSFILGDKDCQNTIDLFLYEQDGTPHYSFIKNFTRLFRTQIT